MPQTDPVETPAATTTHHLFDVFGVELEYMIVDANSCDVRPICDELLRVAAGGIVSEIEMGRLAWSNELALHVVELKTNGPASALSGLEDAFHADVVRINQTLAQWGARLMPSAMHPWMNPDREMRLWPHEYNPVYEALNRIFDCRGHGWANLQSAHLNLPFYGDDEFARLHAAIRLVLPILPALAASSPAMNGQFTGILDNRLEVYRTNSSRIPEITGAVIPEPVYSALEYERQVLEPIYRAIAPHDPEGTLQHEWLNARGAIARFDRGAIEIRVLDVQECPAADLAICQGVVHLLRALTTERWTGSGEQQTLPTLELAEIFNGCVREAHRYRISHERYLRQLGIAQRHCTAGEVWHQALVGLSPLPPALQLILEQGPLAQRMVQAVESGHYSLRTLAAELCDSLSQNRMFTN
ncbi:MAG TPA: glutamate-cysteine ligase family protein [Pirellulaceae bacterium]|nr:glutamate-cysteine ligase family protein [Pirellulaceae bacterium]